LFDLLVDAGKKPRILCKPEQIIHFVGFTPTHYLVSAKPAVTANDYLDIRPGLANMGDDPLDLLPGSLSLILVSFAEAGAEKEISTENVERQIAVIVVVAVKESPFLIAMNDVICGIEVEYDALRRLGVSL
jgi:hypothetical protein